MAFAETFDTYIADFGVIAQGGTCTIKGVNVDGIFDANYFEPMSMVDGSKPMLQLPSANIPAGTVRGTAVVVNGVSYVVADKHPDGTGMTALILEKA